MTATKNGNKVVATTANKDDDKRAILIKVDAETHRGVKVLAALSDTTVTEIVTTLIRNAVAESGADKVKLPSKSA